MTQTRTPRIILACLLAFGLTATAALADYESGIAAFKAGNYAEAAAEFQTIVDESPDYDYGYYILGMSFLKMNKVADAVTNLKKAIELNGDRFDYHSGLAQVLYTQRKYPQVISALNKAEGLAANDKHKYTVYQLRGISNAAQRKWSNAINDLEAAQKIRNTASVAKTLGQAYFAMGYNDKCASQMKAALRANDEDATAQQLLAEANINVAKGAASDSAKQAKYSEALTAAKAFRALEPGVESENLVGRAALGAKDYGTATAAFNKVLSMKSDHCFAMINLGNTFLGQQNWDGAVEPFNRAASCDPSSAAPHEKLGFVYQKKGSIAQNKKDRATAEKFYAQAESHYKKAASLGSSFAKSGMATIAQNMEIMAHNSEQEAIEQKNLEDIAAAEAYNKAEEEKRKAWEERQKGKGGGRR